MAGSISGQLKGLCRQAGAIGKGEFEPSRVHYPISEIEDLKNAMNGMAAELDRTEQKQLAFFQNAPMSFGPRLCPSAVIPREFVQCVPGPCPGSRL